MDDRFKFRIYDFSKKEMLFSNIWNNQMPGGIEFVTNEGLYFIYTEFELSFCNLMQCTGIKDKNGKLIYEGDIIINYSTSFVIKWDEQSLSFSCFDLDGRHSMSIEEKRYYTIIGNKHENPELLEDEI